MDDETYQLTRKRQKRTGTTGLCCSICGEDNPAVIEMHHINGRGNSDQVVPLCKNCHAPVTAQQNSVPPRKRKGKSFEFVTVGAILQVIGKRLADYGHEAGEHG